MPQLVPRAPVRAPGVKEDLEAGFQRRSICDGRSVVTSNNGFGHVVCGNYNALALGSGNNLTAGECPGLGRLAIREQTGSLGAERSGSCTNDIDSGATRFSNIAVGHCVQIAAFFADDTASVAGVLRACCLNAACICKVGNRSNVDITYYTAYATGS